MKLALWFAVAGAALCQAPRPAMEDSIARQRAAIEEQRAAVKRQLGTKTQPTAEFFTVPWTAPLARSEPPLQPPPDAAGCDPVPEDQIAPIVEEMSQREGLTPDLLRAVIEKESSYRPCAVSPVGAQGLMQLMPETAASLGVANPFDPRENVDGGAKYLKEMLDRYGGNLMLALAAYNAGPTRADNIATFPLPAETTSYVSGILEKIGEPAAVK
jgi:soluble lytic murein transglycosylase-like protein